MTDSFCTPYLNPRTGNVNTGGAARNARIATLGGMDKIIATVVSATTDQLLQQANIAKTSEKNG